MMCYAREFGIRVAASFEPEVVSEAFEEKLAQWKDNEAADRYNLTTDWQEGWSGKKLADTSVRNPILKDMAVERALSLYQAYPVLDELHMISREGTSFQADTLAEYLQELKRLEQSLGLEFTEAYIEELQGANEDRRRINPKAYPYWTVLPGVSYMGSVIGAFRYLEFAREILADDRLKKLRKNKKLEFVISLYSPNPKTMELVSRYAGKVIPKGVRFDLLGDYGARDIYNQMDGWQPLLDAGTDTGMISWLEFDGNMALAQGWTRAIYDNVKKAQSMGIQTVYFNHWRLHSLEQNAHLAAKTCFDTNQSYETYMSDYVEKLFGRAQIPVGLLAYDVLEQATINCKEHHYNVGFTGDWVYQHSTDSPGYPWRELMHTAQLYELAGQYFRQASKRGLSDGARHGRYMADLCQISSDHLKAVSHLQNSKLPLMGYQCFPVSQDGNWPGPEVLKDCVHEAWLALQYTYAYMKRYSRWVAGSDEQGQLAHHQLGMVEPLENHYRTLKAKYERSVEELIGDDGYDQVL